MHIPKRILGALAALTASLTLLIGPSHAQQTAKVVATCGSASYTAGSVNYQTVDTAGNSCGAAGGAPTGTQNVNLTQIGSTTVVTGGVAGSQGVGGLAAAGAAVAGNPVRSGLSDGTNIQDVRSLVSLPTTGVGLQAAGLAAIFNTTPPTRLTGEYGAVQMTSRGEIYTAISNGATSAVVTAATDGTNSFNGVVATARNQLQGTSTTSWNNQRDIIGAAAAGTGTTAVHMAPTTNINASTTAGQCTVACASLIVSGAHNIYGVEWSATVTGWLFLEDATSCAANGTITPVRAYAYPTANATQAVSWGDVPRSVATGMAWCFSTTGPYTATASTTAFIGADYK